MARLHDTHTRTALSRCTSPVILIVDDNPQNLELLATWAADVPARIVVASDGVEALAELSQQRPDLIALDVMMPRMSGFEVCRRLKADPSTRAIPILVVTALDEPEDIQSARLAGPDAVMSKPVSRAELLQQIRILLGDAGDGG